MFSVCSLTAAEAVTDFLLFSDIYDMKSSHNNLQNDGTNIMSYISFSISVTPPDLWPLLSLKPSSDHHLSLPSAPGWSHRQTLWPLAKLRRRLKQEEQTCARLQLRCSSTNTTGSERSTGAVKTTSVYWCFIMWCLTFTNEYSHPTALASFML